MTKIEWTNKTLNVIAGCTKYSEGCQNCYAEKMHKRLQAMGISKYSHPFNCVKYDYFAINNCKFLKSKKRYMIFLNSMADTFHNDVSDNTIKAFLSWFANDFHQHIFQILTKRAERLPYFNYPKSVWLGVTVEMVKYKSRMEYLKETNAKVKFLSCEPLLEDLGELDLSGIDWVIAGGESGTNARPCHPDWVRNIQKQCQEQNVPFFFKQWGEWFPRSQWEDNPELVLSDENALIFQGEMFNKVGKKKAGALLDGVEYKEFPKCPE